jgi:hypothetical protein
MVQAFVAAYLIGILMALPLYDPSGTQLTDRQQANQADPDAFGAGVGRAAAFAGQQLVGLGKTMAAIEEEEKRKSDATAVIAADAEASARLRKGLYGEGGIFTRTGVNADGMTLTTEELTKNIGSDISKKLTDPAQKLAFDNMWNRRTESTLDAAAKNEFGQRQTTRTATKTAALANITADVIANYRNPEMIETNLDATRRIIRSNPDGLPAEMVEQLERESISSVHVSLIQRLAQDSPGDALDYYEKHKSQVYGADHAAANKFISGVQTIRTARTATEEIANTGPSGSLAEAMFFGETGGEADPGAAASEAGAAGDAQLMPKTAREVAASMPGLGPLAAMTDDELQAHWQTPQGRKDNRRIGATYLQTQLTKYKGDVEAALIAYNAGPKNADLFLNNGRDYSKLPKPEETLPYVNRVLSKYTGQKIDGKTSEEIQRSLKGGSPQAYYDGDAGEFLKTVLQKQHGPEHVDGMDGAMKDRLAALFSAAPPEVREGLDILSGKRSAERQSALWEASDKTGKMVARPGNSRHEHGDAADLGWKGGKFASAPENVKEWVHANAAAYGLRFPMSYEPWHIETVEARGGKTPKGKASKPGPADVARVKGRFADDLDGTDTRNFSGRVKDDDVGMVELAAAPPGNAADIYTKAVEPFNVNPTATDLDNWLKTARDRYGDNPSLLAEVERQLGDEYTLRENARKNAIENGMRQVFADILAGKTVREQDPALLQTLGAENVGKLLTTETKMLGGDDETDDATYIRISKMTPEELAEYDLIQDADKLSKTDLKHWADKAAEFKRGGDQVSKRTTDRTRANIMEEAENILALDPNGNPEDAKSLRLLNQQLDGQIAVFMKNNGGKEPTGPDMQAMVDQLLLEGHIEKWGPDETKPVYELTDAERNIVQFAVDINGIPDMDKPVVSKGFRAIYNATPNEEGAVDFYNDLMRVRLGGTPAPPEALDAKIRQGLLKAKGRPPTADEIALVYSEWIKRATVGDK